MLAAVLAWAATSPVAAVEREFDIEPAALAPGDYTWSPTVSPAGPVMVFVSLASQRVYVYRNGALIGVSTTSTGTDTHPTPTGVFRILERKTRHRSNLYDAEMPYMHRLTWDGIALHAGNVSRPRASHGCVRLPAPFAARLFEVARRGTLVVISDATHPAIALDELEPPAPTRPPLAAGARGPTTVIVSAADGAATVFRAGEPIGRTAVKFRAGEHEFPTRTFMLTAIDGGQRQWMSLWPTPFAVEAGRLRERFVVDHAFATRVLDLLVPGDVVVVTARRATAPTPAPDILSAGE